MLKHQKIQIAIFLYIIALIYSVIYNLNGHPYLMMVPVSALVPFILSLLFKILKLKMTDRIFILNLLFCFLASIVGSTLSGYEYPYYDKVIHFISGLIICICGYLLFCIIKKVKRIKEPSDMTLMYIFMNTFNLAVAVLWEFYEYMTLIFFNYDCINHYTTGVHDSITDMLCAFGGGIIITLLVYHSYKYQKPNFITKIYEELYEKNTNEKE